MPEREKRIAFIVGCPRSGTTLVQQLLNAHPRVSIGPETHYVRRFWVARDRYGDTRADAGWSALVRDISAIPELRDGGVDPAAFVAAASRLPHEHSALLRLLMELFAVGRNVSVIGEKTPNHVLYMRLLQDWFPEALFVHVVRDPRAVVNSWRTVPWSTGSVSGDAAVWRRYVKSAVRNRPEPDRVLDVRYERLVAQPEAELRRLCGFLGVPFDPGMLCHDRAAGQGVDAQREPWKAGATESLHPLAVDRWKEALSARQVLAIEGVVGRSMRLGGYRPTTSALARIPVGLFSRRALPFLRLLRRPHRG